MTIDVQQIFNQAIAALNSSNLKKAEEDFRRVIELDNSHVPALNLLTVVLMSSGRFSDAEPFIARAVAINQSSDVSFYNYGLIAKNINKPELSIEKFTKAISIKSNVAETWNNRGTIYNELKRYDLAIADFNKALSINPNYAEAYANKGKSLSLLQRYDEAFAAFDKALSIKPDLGGAWLGRGNVFYDLKRYDESLDAYDKSLSIKPDLAEAWLGRGNVFYDLKRYDDALDAYDKSLSIKPELEFLYGTFLHTKMRICDWNDLTDNLSRLEKGILENNKITMPFPVLGLTDSPELQLKASKNYAQTKYPRSSVFSVNQKFRRKEKIKLGYLSADFQNHATAYLMAQLFELHDRSKFEVHGFSFGPNINDEMRDRLFRGFDLFHDVCSKSSRDIAKLSRGLDIDIAVDLKGYTKDARTELFAEGCAPIQVAYIGYPGTMGNDYIDYVIADQIVIPEANTIFFAEKIVYLPHSYQVNDSKRKISDKIFTKKVLGLPEQGFVYCCFNNNYKILPQVYDSWMRILNAVEGSVLWLFEDNATAANNLRKEAQLRGIDGHRLVFAPRMQLDEHLARHRLADLFLDTLPYNAHTSASDALWAGLPVLTMKGNAFAGRVAASLLYAAGLPELVTHSRAEYEALAIDLALNNQKITGYREKLQRNRLTLPLFDTALYTKHLEEAYEAMYQRAQAGLPPDHIEIQSMREKKFT